MPKPEPGNKQDIDGELLKTFTQQYFGRDDFYFSCFFVTGNSGPQFCWMEWEEFQNAIDGAWGGGGLGDEKPTPQVIRNNRDILAGFLEKNAFEVPDLDAGN